VTNAYREALSCGNYSYFGSLSTDDVSRGCFTAFELFNPFPSRFFFTAVQSGRPLYLGKIERTKTGQYNCLSQNSHHNTFVPTPLHMYMVIFLLLIAPSPANTSLPVLLHPGPHTSFPSAAMIFDQA
jgi:hypothetical protein